MNEFKICYVSTEVAPFADSIEARGLANTSKSLPVALKDMGQDVRLMMPKYKSINERKYVLREVIRLREVSVNLDGKPKQANGKTAFLPNSKVHVYFLGIPEYFDRKGFYADPNNGKPYVDNAERFANFCKGVLETLKLLYWQPDIIHCCDWGTALIPYYLKTHYGDDEFFANTRTVLTIHNIAAQGEFPLTETGGLGIDEAHLQEGGTLVANGKFNMLKGGLNYADLINLVSEQKTQALLDNPDLAGVLTDVVSGRAADIVGISGGEDYNEWNPEADKYLEAEYDLDTVERKVENRTALCGELGLAENDHPLIAIPAEFDSDAELKSAIDIFTDLVKKEVRLVFLGNGNMERNAALEKFAEAHDGQAAFIPKADPRLSHLVMGAADLLLVPSVNDAVTPYHLRGLRYGVIPITPAIGRFVDAIRNIETDALDGNGFVLPDIKKASVLKTVKEAIACLNDPERHAQLVQNGMRADYSWHTTAQHYLELYDRASYR